VGKTFQEIMKMCYFCSIDLSDSFVIDYDEINKVKKEVFQTKKSGILLIGIETKGVNAQSAKFFLNPLNYTIKEGDIGYVVAYDNDHARTITNLTEHSHNYSIYKKNMNFLKRVKLEESNAPFIAKLSHTIKKNLANWEINPKKFFQKHNKELKESELLQMKLPQIFDLREHTSPRGIFKNHIIIKGNLSRLSRIAEVIRKYGQRPILLFTDSEINPSTWHKIREAYQNIFCVIGSPTKVKDIIQLDPKKAFKILILSGNYNNTNQDAESIIFTRMISDVFELTNFLTEIIDESNLKYLSINPKYPNLDYYFWPFFVRGGVHFSSFAMSIVAKTLINRNLLSFIQNFAESKNSSEEGEKCNEQIHTMIITSEAAKEFQLFGHLQFSLMSSQPSTIAIAILKSKSKDIHTFGSMLSIKPKTNPSKHENSISLSNEISRLMGNFYGSEFLMTNPSFLMPVEAGDKVLIIGNMTNEEIEENIMTRSITSSLHKASTDKNGYEIGNPKGFKEELNSAMCELNEVMKLMVNNWDDVKEKIKGKKKKEKEFTKR